MSEKYTVPVSEAARRSGFSHQQILNRLNRKTLKGKKFGVVWLLRESTVQQLITVQIKK